MKEKTRRTLIILGMFFCLGMIMWGLFEDVKGDKDTKTLIIGHDTVFKAIRSDIKTIRIDIDTVKHHLKIN